MGVAISPAIPKPALTGNRFSGFRAFSRKRFAFLTDETAFARKRAMLRDEWSKEKRRTRHRGACNRRRAAWQSGAIGRAEWLAACECPVLVSPPVPDHLIEQALALLHPTGIPFLDMAMLHGRFPGTKTRFCTDETKLIPMMYRKLDTPVHQ